MPYLTMRKKPKATTKPWFSRLLRHPARKQSGSILVHNTHPGPTRIGLQLCTHVFNPDLQCSQLSDRMRLMIYYRIGATVRTAGQNHSRCNGYKFTATVSSNSEMYSAKIVISFDIVRWRALQSLIDLRSSVLFRLICDAMLLKRCVYFLNLKYQKLDNVAIANALQLEAARGTSALFRYNYDATCQFWSRWAYPLPYYSVFASDTLLYAVTLTFDLEHLQCIAYYVVKLCAEFGRNRAIIILLIFVH